MATTQDTRTASPRSFYRYPAGRIVAVLADAAAVDGLLDALEAAGVDLSDVETIHGEDGRARVGRDGRGHGTWARFQRSLTAAMTSDSENVVVLCDTALRSGHHLVALPAPAARAGSGVVRLLADHGTRVAFRFNRWTVETLSMRPRRLLAAA